jgi:hypothetical protein
MTKRIWYPGIYIAVLLAGSLAGVGAGQRGGGAVQIDNDDIGGVVTSAKGPEAGVWVIAETKDLPTGFSKSVVTDDRGRYVVPDLPPANYQVWVRGYGLVDSQKVQSAPGKIVNLTAVVAPNPRAAAEYYPANYWFALIKWPNRNLFPGTGPSGNGIGATMKTQGQFIENVKTDGCLSCHQLGNQATREIPKSLGTFESSTAAWARRVASGQDGGQMDGQITTLGRQPALAMFADWTDRITAGEYPQDAPPRPQGVERNVVITQWDWADPREYFHDVVASDKRDPTVNPYGPVYGLHENSSDHMTILEPTKNSWSQATIPFNPKATLGGRGGTMPNPSPYWGSDVIWSTKINAHSNEIDQKARAWNTSVTRTAAEMPDYCKPESGHPSAKLTPGGRGNRQLTVYDPKTKQFDIVDVCFGTFHLNFAADANNTLWSGQGGLVGWVNTKMWDETKDAGKSQGWTQLILDTNGNGKRDAAVEPNDPVDPAKDKRIQASFYAVMPSPADGSVWGSVLGFPGAFVRLNPGANPPETALAEIYQVPWQDPKASGQGYSPRGLDVDRNGVAWAVLSSGQVASFDRRKCKGPLNGPNATGQQCPEGWTFYTVPGPNFKGDVESSAADSNYYIWVDKFNSLGLGENIPIATGNNSGSMLALVGGKFVVLRVPYPLGFYNKSVNGRIDDPKAGWKGKGLWTGWANRTPWHIEGGKGTTGKAVHFQVRPDPLAK